MKNPRQTAFRDGDGGLTFTLELRWIAWSCIFFKNWAI